jgi:hypothetical protein
LIFAPFFGSFFNRIGAKKSEEKPFYFQKEVAFRMSRFGFLSTLQQESPTGFHLFVADESKNYRFRYEKQAYFPLTERGQKILLPVKIGFFGFPIIDLK